MQAIKQTSREEKLYLYGSIYVLLSTIIFGVINYFTWSPGVVTEVSALFLLSWIPLYLPMIVFNQFADWRVSEFGFVVDKRTGIVAAISLLFGVWVCVKEPTLWMFDRGYYSLIEAFARVGEELYFRGFIYLLVLKLFKAEKKPYIWAIVLSSIVFAAMHTQTFLPEYGTSLFSVFLSALLLAYLRHKTDSLLPGITIHSFLKGSLLGILFGWAIYALFVLWDYIEKRHIAQMNLPIR